MLFYYLKVLKQIQRAEKQNGKMLYYLKKKNPKPNISCRENFHVHMTFNNCKSNKKLTTSCSPTAEVIEPPSGFGALGSLGLAAISSSMSSSS